MVLRVLALAASAALWCTAAQHDLKMYFIDVEGGQATLIVAPSGQSLLIDTGWPGNNGRDADRIAEAAKEAHVKKIDYVLITHFHVDHVGGATQLTNRIPVGEFLDHGTSVEHDADAEKLFADYDTTRNHIGHKTLKPGDKIPLRGVNIDVLTANGEQISAPATGGGEKNDLCGSEPRREVDTGENARSIGTLITFGKFRALDLGDLTWNKEQDLVCPMNRVGKVDVYVVTHHGMNLSGSATAVHAFAPEVAVMDNGARKGGTAEAYQVIKSSPGLQDIWQLHYAVAGGDKNNTAQDEIANPTESPDQGFGIRLTAHPDGSYSVTNLRSGFSKQYQSR